MFPVFDVTMTKSLTGLACSTIQSFRGSPPFGLLSISIGLGFASPLRRIWYGLLLLIDGGRNPRNGGLHRIMSCPLSSMHFLKYRLHSSVSCFRLHVWANGEGIDATPLPWQPFAPPVAAVFLEVFLLICPSVSISHSCSFEKPLEWGDDLTGAWSMSFLRFLIIEWRGKFFLHRWDYQTRRKYLPRPLGTTPRLSVEHFKDIIHLEVIMTILNRAQSFYIRFPEESLPRLLHNDIVLVILAFDSASYKSLNEVWTTTRLKCMNGQWLIFTPSLSFECCSWISWN